MKIRVTGLVDLDITIDSTDFDEIWNELYAAVQECMSEEYSDEHNEKMKRFASSVQNLIELDALATASIESNGYTLTVTA